MYLTEMATLRMEILINRGDCCYRKYFSWQRHFGNHLSTHLLKNPICPLRPDATHGGIHISLRDLVYDIMTINNNTAPHI